jgi:hypothetical protein
MRRIAFLTRPEEEGGARIQDLGTFQREIGMKEERLPRLEGE